MKRIFLPALLLITFAASAQKDSLAPPFKRYPTLPPLQVVLADSVTKYTKADLPKNKAVAVLLFSPDCEHCQHEASEIASRQAELKNVHFVLVTPFPIYRMKAFAETYGLTNLPNVVVTKDPYYLLIPFYDVRNFPFLALYNKKGKLLFTHEGSKAIDKVVEALRK